MLFTVDTIELKGFLQGYVDHETNMNAAGSCRSNCADYRNTQNYRCNADTLCSQEAFQSDKQRCKGRLRNCQPLEGDINVCPTVSRILKYIMEYSVRRLIFSLSLTDGTENFTSVSLHRNGQWTNLWQKSHVMRRANHQIVEEMVFQMQQLFVLL